MIPHQREATDCVDRELLEASRPVPGNRVHEIDINFEQRVWKSPSRSRQVDRLEPVDQQTIAQVLETRP